MKFTNGYWLSRDEYTINSPKECYDFKRDNDVLTLYAPYKRIRNHNDTLNLGMSTIKLSSPIKDVIDVKLIHFDQNDKEPHYEVTNQHPNIEITTNKDDIKFITGDLIATIPYQKEFCITFSAKGKAITSSKLGAQGEIMRNDGVHFMREQLSLDIDELIYGLGERFTPFIKNGQTVDIWNNDGGTGSEQSYKNIPFYLSNKGYGIFVNQPEKISYEIASENVSSVQFSVPGESLEYYVIYGPTAKEILEKYTSLTGKPVLPPAWSFGLWLSTSFTTDYSEKSVMEFIDGMKKRDIPLEVFHFDCFWQKGFEWCNFEWDRNLFPDPAGMLKKIHDKGLKICLWINPYISQKSPLFNECKEEGYFIKRQDGNVWQWDLWQAGQGIIDFTNPNAVNWYRYKLSKLLDMGVDCFKTDFGERIPTKDASFYDGSDPERAHNYYAYLYNKIVFDLLKEKKGEHEAVLFARVASVGSQKFPVHWGGDNLSQYSSMADSLRGGLSFLLSGFSFWSHDIGGFEENATADLYKRWTQFGLLSSHSRYHGNIQYRVPWNFDEEAVNVTRKFVKLKLSLMPYIYKESVEATEKGIPLMRPVFLEYGYDINTYYLDKEYMLGSRLLVSPIFRETGYVKYYLPQGNWTNLLTEQTYKVIDSGRWLEEQYDYLNLPLLVRENTILLINPKATKADYDYTDSLEIHLYEIKDGKLETTVCDTKGTCVGKVTVKCNGIHLQVSQIGLKGESKVVIHKCGKKQEETLSGEILDINFS